jgi:hypothetical protein
MRLRYRAPELLRGAPGALIDRGLVALTARRRGRATVISLSTFRQLRDLGFRRERVAV